MTDPHHAETASGQGYRCYFCGHGKDDHDPDGLCWIPREPLVHDLKTWPKYFKHLLDGSKTFEVRKNDRSFRAGDSLRLREWEPNPFPDDQSGHYTGREITVLVTYVLRTGKFKLPDHVIMGIRPSTPAVRSGEVEARGHYHRAYEELRSLCTEIKGRHDAEMGEEECSRDCIACLRDSIVECIQDQDQRLAYLTATGGGDRRLSKLLRAIMGEHYEDGVGTDRACQDAHEWIKMAKPLMEKPLRPDAAGGDGVEITEEMVRAAVEADDQGIGYERARWMLTAALRHARGSERDRVWTTTCLRRLMEAAGESWADWCEADINEMDAHVEGVTQAGEKAEERLSAVLAAVNALSYCPWCGQRTHSPKCRFIGIYNGNLR